jgi:HAMP domain-containing protein
LGITFLAALYTARRIGNPLSVMAQVASEIHDGSMDKRSPSNKYEELSNLSNAFNSMTDQLHQSLEEDTGGQLKVTIKTIVIGLTDEKMLLKVAPGEYVELVSF